MKKIGLSLLCFIFVGYVLIGCGGSSSHKKLQLVWEEQFDGATLNNSEWRITEQGNNYNNEDQAYTKEQVSVIDGCLSLVCKVQEWMGPSGRPDEPGVEVTRYYVSGEVNTVRSWKYGRFEIRASIPPQNQGILSAIWMTPVDKDWPPEIDIMEILGHDPTTVYFTNHYGTAEDPQKNSGNYQAADFSGDFHVYTIEWQPGVIKWFVDDIQRFESKIEVPGEPFILRVSLPVGPDWEQNPDGTSEFPQTMKVDWVRVYQ
jgi:beta-glucanase (GH16 family)